MEGRSIAEGIIMSMSSMGLARMEGIEVLPTCSMPVIEISLRAVSRFAFMASKLADQVGS